MRRLLAFSSVLILVLSQPVASAPGPGVAVGAEQAVEAFWIVGKGPSPDFYFVFAGRRTRMKNNKGLVSYAFVGRGSCQSSRGGGFRLTICSGSGPSKQIPLEDLEISPDLSSAKLTMRGQHYTHRVQWKGVGTLPPSGHDSVTDECSTALWAGAFRSGRARGRLFGQKLEKEKDPMYADLYSYAAGAAWACNRRMSSDGTYRVEIRERI